MPVSVWFPFAEMLTDGHNIGCIYVLNEIRKGFETAYIDGSVASNELYRSQFVSNNYNEGKKVISSIEDELLTCGDL